jgi:signal transduction histidine kinase
MKTVNVLILLSILSVSVLTSISAGTDLADANATPGMSATSSMSENTSIGELVAFVEQAVAYALENGKDKALQEFNDQKGDFVRGESYIFAYDFEGNTLALPFQPDLIGKNRMEIRDIYDVPFIRILTEQAKRGSGFAYYIYPNPGENMTDELKLSFAMKVDDTWWLGSGIYLTDIPSYFKPESREDLVEFVEDAISYAKTNGKDEAILQFNDKNGKFVREDCYIFAYDFEAISLAHPFQPDMIGQNLSDYQDVNGVKLKQVMADLAKTGGGFSYYVYANPTKNMTKELKLSYAKKIDDTWWLASGIYATSLYETVENMSLPEPTSKDELIAFVESAVTFARNTGRQKAIEAFMDTEGPFVIGESYIFAHDFNGTALALPYIPSEVGTNRMDLQDADGVYINREMRSIAMNGSGFFQYVYRNPNTNTIEPKISYVMKVDDSWWLGSGIYLPQGK